jgi:hypothetical protein
LTLIGVQSFIFWLDSGLLMILAVRRFLAKDVSQAKIDKKTALAWAGIEPKCGGVSREY